MQSSSSAFFDAAQVEAELQQLQDSGIISKVHWSEWSTIETDNGVVCLYGDFKVIVNLTLHVDLPGVEDIFASFASGKQDQPSLSLQMETKNSEKHHLMTNTYKGLFNITG